MKQTQLVQLASPYAIMWDEEHLRICKHIATLIEVDYDKNGELRTIEHVVDETGRVWSDGTLDECELLCREYESIDLDRFCTVYSFAEKKRDNNPFFSLYSLANWLRYYDIDVVFPGEKEADGKVIEYPVNLLLGENDSGDFWVESLGMLFNFWGRHASKEALKNYLIFTRNEYYRAFPQKKFQITFQTKNDDWKSFLDIINNTKG